MMDFKIGSIITVKNAQISNYCYKSLEVDPLSAIQIDPYDFPRLVKLRDWYYPYFCDDDKTVSHGYRVSKLEGNLQKY